jgi:hypothetical protein
MQGRSFAWPDRDRSAEIERAADRAAELGLERLREQRRKRLESAPKAPPADLSFLAPSVPEEVEAEDPGDEAEEPPPLKSPELWEAEFDDLAEKLVADLRRDLGPDGR